MFQKVIVIFLFLFNPVWLYAQSDTSGFKGKTALMLDLFGPELVGGYVNYYTGNRISVNAGIGINLSLHLGTNVYLIKRNNSRHSVYLGGQIAFLRMLTMNLGPYGKPPEPDSQAGFYIPAGYEYIGKKKLIIQVDVGPNFVAENWDQFNTYPVIFSIKIGKIL